MRIRFWTMAVLGAVLGLGSLIEAGPATPVAHAQSSAQDARVAEEVRLFGNYNAAHQAVVFPVVQSLNNPETLQLLNAMFATGEGGGTDDLERSLETFEAFAADVVRASLEAEAAIPPKPTFDTLLKVAPSQGRDLVKMADLIEANTQAVVRDVRSLPVELADAGRAMLAGDDEAIVKASRLMLVGLLSTLKSENRTMEAQIPLLERRGQPMRQIVQMQLKNNRATATEAEMDLSDFDAPLNEASDVRAARRRPFIQRMQRDIKGWKAVETTGRAQIDAQQRTFTAAVASTSDPKLKDMLTTIRKRAPEMLGEAFDVESQLLELMEQRIAQLEENGPDMETELESILERETELVMRRLKLAAERTALLQ